MSNTKNEIVVYQPNETVRLEVELHDESIWLTQLKIAELFGVQKAAISKHLKNIFEAGELQEPSVVSKMETTAADGKRYKTAFYNLDAIIAVGYRVNSARATQFRIWATQVLKAYLLKGYAVNQRLNALEDRVDRRMAKFNAQHGGLTVRRSKNFHDRFLIIDDKTLFVFGASLKDLGSKCFAFTKLDASEIPMLKARI